MTCCSPLRVAAMDLPMKRPMPAAVVALAVAAAAGVVAVANLAVRVEAVALNGRRAHSLRSAHLHGALRRRRLLRRGLDAKLSPKMRVKREFPVLSQLSPSHGFYAAKMRTLTCMQLSVCAATLIPRSLPQL
jgi:hypothetical protein